MKFFALLLITIGLWIAYEIWRAPLMEENEDGVLRVKRPTKKLKDLWQRRH
jgi:hypothetical protein